MMRHFSTKLKTVFLLGKWYIHDARLSSEYQQSENLSSPQATFLQHYKNIFKWQRLFLAFGLKKKTHRST